MLSQYETILKCMIENKYNKVWLAKDFQSGNYFVGYEASARMSELADKYKFIDKVRVARFRGIKLNWKYKREIKEIYEIIKFKESLEI